MDPSKSNSCHTIPDTVSPKAVCVMGGSFNPPTLAHLKLMETALAFLPAGKGIFVPVSQAALKRKMRKSGSFCIESELRIRMLQTMCGKDDRLYVSLSQMESPVFRTNQMLSEIQEQNPNISVFFLAGADKIPLIAEWCEKYDFLQKFHLGLFARDGVDLRKSVGKEPRLSLFSDRIIFLPLPDETDGISSTRVRECLLDGRKEETRSLLAPGVYELLPDAISIDIERFRGDYAFLDNSFPAIFHWRGQDWQCAESAIQAASCKEDLLLFSACDGKTAKKIVAKKEKRDDWKEIRLAVTEEILTEKFRQNPELKEKLIQTGKARIIYGHDKKEYFWGRNLYTDKGENHLGEILMHIRETMKKEGSF